MHEAGVRIRRAVSAVHGEGGSRARGEQRQCDTELTCIQAYDVWKEKNMYGRKTMGVVRTTYLIDEEGVIVRAFGKVKAADNPAQMLGEL